MAPSGRKRRRKRRQPSSGCRATACSIMETFGWTHWSERLSAIAGPPASNLFFERTLMNVQQEIDRAIETIKKTGKMIRFLREHQQLVDSLRCPVDIFNGRVDFNYPTHSETIQIIKALGGKWKKGLNLT